MSMSLAQLKAQRANPPETLPTSQLLDTLNKINGNPPSIDRIEGTAATSQIVSPIPESHKALRAAKVSKTVPASLASGTTIFFTNSGSGSIIIDTVEYRLPLTTSDRLLISRIKAEYPIGALHCPIKMRIV